MSLKLHVKIGQKTFAATLEDNPATVKFRQMLPLTLGIIVFTQVVPFPWGVVPPIVGEYRAAMKRHAPNDELTFSSFEGYINARVLVAGLRLAGKNLSADGLVAALENAGDIDMGGYRVHYSPTSRVGSTFVDTVLARRDGRFRAR